MLILSSVLAFLALGEAKIDFNRVHRLIHPNQVPSHAKDNFKVKVVKSSDAATTYFVANEFVGQTTCDGWASAQFGIAFNSCFSNSDTTTAKYEFCFCRCENLSSTADTLIRQRRATTLQLSTM